MLFKATLSRLLFHCSSVTNSRRKRQADEEEELQHLNKDLMTDAVNSDRDKIAEVFVEFLFIARLYPCGKLSLIITVLPSGVSNTFH